MKSIIAINWNDDESGIEYVTIEEGGELENAGKMLCLYYDNTDDAQELIDRGNIKTLGRTVYHSIQPDYHYKPLEIPSVPDVASLLSKLIEEKAYIAYVWDVDNEEWRAYSNIILPELADLLGEGNGVALESYLWKEPWIKEREKQKVLRDAYNIHSFKDVIERCGGAVSVCMDEQWDYMEPIQSGKNKDDDEDENEPECFSFLLVEDSGGEWIKENTNLPLWYHNKLECYVVGKTFCGISWDDESTCPDLK